MSGESSRGPGQRPGRIDQSSGLDRPDPFVRGLAPGEGGLGPVGGESRSGEGGSRPPDEPDPFAAGLAENDGPAL